ncbi:MAG: PAS domain S-box protein [Thiomicrospira sp.]|uniref:methyl-accepting chemotaxis protein n=1 Tax=Thiomicrospira sp. TaxID=935 RepID=UPI001A0057D7|nr:methyl-accepting chemotaxis protein [Thiomicrospira sp.]MBE0493510.1 PAS domain S-box protein [Thiomicrospira sp.]
MQQGQEFQLSPDMVILSTSDLKGNIVDYNEGFREASGYSDKELVGKPHNILRHEDMPKEAFKDFWQTIQAGRPWFGMVKNKRKNGDYYWVAANASPIIENGQITGYLSVRYPATQEQKQFAQRLYADVKAGHKSFPWTTAESKITKWLKTLVPLGLAAMGFIGLLIQASVSMVSIISTFVFLVGLVWLIFNQLQNHRIPLILRRGIEDLSNGHFKKPIKSNSDWGFALNMIRSRVAERAARNYDELKATQVMSTALNAASTNIMVADADFNIKSMNKSLEQMFAKNEHKLQQALINFKASEVVGSNMDVFHKDRAHQRKMVAQMVEPWTGELKVAGLVLRLTVVPILHKKERLGYVVEWLDRTEEANITQNIIEVMEMMNEGSFDSRVTADAEGVLLLMKDNINSSMQRVAEAVNAISEVVEAQAAGDLTHELPKDVFKGQLHDLKNAINYSTQKVKEIVNIAIDAAIVVSEASSQVSQGASDLSERVQSQAAALEQTSATMNEMASAIQNNSEHSRKVAELAYKVKSDSIDSTKVMQETVDAMSAIQRSSHQISDIVTLIDSIAFQTNLLALNAAVEAARAGDHGRGFAVVAGEVRGLAQKSAEAAKDIRNLIEDTVSRVEKGTSLAKKSGDNLNGITHAVEEVAEMINQIAHSSAEQSEGINQVHQAIVQIDGVTQQNAALVEETTAAAETLSSEAKHLRETMSYFKTETDQNCNKYIGLSSSKDKSNK